jgi:hypothetical protein
MRTYTTKYKFTLKYCNNLISKQMTDYWWTISPPGYHPPSSQCFGTDTIYYIYLLVNLQFLNMYFGFFFKSKAFFLQAWMTLSDIGYPIKALCPYLAFQSFNFEHT